jgi:hypothetical protein
MVRACFAHELADACSIDRLFLLGTLQAKLLSGPTFRRTDLLVLMASQPTMPSYAALLAAGFTTWPENWSTEDNQSKLHGCYNGFGLMFPEGLLGVQVNLGVGVHPAWPPHAKRSCNYAAGIGRRSGIRCF